MFLAILIICNSKGVPIGKIEIAKLIGTKLVSSANKFQSEVFDVLILKNVLPIPLPIIETIFTRLSNTITGLSLLLLKNHKTKY